ncbi:ATP-binding cassette domain-containing protein [Halovulum dunhuangense]|uniref:ATP-binding cassette domain-containing protein n=1 Tax=Halovulum dunhuangense TaxID=1505036 RepID=A0A849L4H8_9RHOB|nr:metal ABC transporter ATP-binding protein [Halovulum dunhuangense]NNU81163.1 ATP-binding cassette domain-containing protein [Halovulum dunhuangense]
MSALIEARDVSHGYGGDPVLSHVSLAIAPNEIVTVVGPNGSGKSTLMRLLIGADRPRKGRITRKRGLRIGYVPQRLAIDHSLPITVGRFLSLGERTSPGDRAAMLARVGVEGREERQMSALSGGEFQRVLLAKALLMRPDILALDEATQGLDQPGVAAFYRLIEEVRHEMGCAVLMISHDLHVVMSASDRVICLNGHICCEGTPTVVSSAPAYRALFGLGTEGALALYRHEHDHSHDRDHGHGHVHAPQTEGAA